MGQSKQAKPPPAASAAPPDGGYASPEPSGGMGNADFVRYLMSEKKEDGDSRFHGIIRGADEIRDSGVLDDARKLDATGPKAPKSELDRTIEDDAEIVMRGFSKMTPEEIALLKEKAYQDPEIAQDLPAAIEKKHYGSEKHRQYGMLIEKLTGGIISAEEAMAMNPTGGLPGPGAKELPLLGKIDAISRHAERHDADGFLLTHFGVGPGYSTKTTAVGHESDNPLGGQILGVLREVISPSELPKAEEAAKPERFA